MKRLFDTFLLSNEIKNETGSISHFHTHYSIGFILKGSHYLYNNRKKYYYKFGDLRVINPCEIHSTNGINWKYINITINSIKLKEYANDIEQNAISYPINFHTKIDQNRLIKNILLNYSNSINNLEKELLENNFLEVLLKHYIRDNKIKQVNIIHTKKELKTAKDYIYSNFSNQNLTIENIAKNIGLSPYYFARSFKNIFGLSPHRYIQNLRLEESYKYIIDNKLPLSEIAYICGFSDQSHMIRIFKKYYGFTPAKLLNLSSTQCHSNRN